LRCFPLPYWF